MDTDVNSSPTSSHYNMHTTLQLVGGMLKVGRGWEGTTGTEESTTFYRARRDRREQDNKARARNCSWVQQTRG